MTLKSPCNLSKADQQGIVCCSYSWVGLCLEWHCDVIKALGRVTTVDASNSVTASGGAGLADPVLS